MSEMIANRYLLAHSLGFGGMADVYLAMDTVLNREVAIKVLRSDLSVDPVALLRFKREANAASCLNHPNIVEIYDVGEYDNKPYIVMEYVRGVTLKQLLKKREVIGYKEAVNIMKQLVSAVCMAHDNNIIHRDIKPQNVLIKDDGTIKITDFGIAQTNDSIQLTQTDSVVGSVHYLAPEIARGESASFQSDIYSLGIVFYELLCGKVPFEADSPIQIAMMHMEKEVQSVKMFDSSIPQSIDNIIIKATAKNKANRYLNAHEMLKDLEEALDQKKLNEKRVIFKDSLEETKMIPKVSIADKKTVDKKTLFQGSILAFLGLVVIALSVCLVLLITTSNNPKTFEMIDLENKTVEQAQTLLEEKGLSIGKISYQVSDDKEKGLIISTNPSAYSTVEKGSVISLVVSDGIYFVVDDYVGKTEEEVKELLASTNIEVMVQKEVSNEYPYGTIIRQELLLKGDKCSPNRRYTIKLIVSDYASLIIPTSLINMDIYEAETYLEDRGARVILEALDTSNLSEDELKDLEKNVVIDIDPKTSYYTQKEDSYITLYYYQ